MDNVLSQAEIDALVRAARAGGRSDKDKEQYKTQSPPRPPVELWDVRRAGQIGREQLQAITLLHEGFARNLTHSLAAYLRVAFSATLVSAEHLTYREFLQSVPETTYLASCRLEPAGASALLQLDLKAAFAMIDLLLGGEGKATFAAREITDIEAQILNSVARIICRELGVAWQALALEVGFEDRLEPGEARRLMPPEEKTLSLSFEIAVVEMRGGLNLAIPSAISTALLRKIAGQWSHPRTQAAPQARQRLMRRLLDCPFRAELGATGLGVAVRELVDLRPGQVLAFDRSADTPAALVIAGVEFCRAVPARSGRSRAARIVERLTESETAGKE